ncbi:MAG TPA: hypothetical protein VE954_26165, partial [Oligoflexus sp.]|uniref:hypothetical protein n=1 Tax=Oligoflexus sp. TaxID=1971216 RepID=UPI002D398044
MLHIWNLNVLMLLVTGLFVPVRAFGEPLVALREEKAEYLLGKYLRYIEDQDGSLTFSEIRSDEF